MIVGVTLWLQVQMGTTVVPETVTVGQHFSAMVRVRVPNGTRLVFPTGPDSAARVDSAGSTGRRAVVGSQFTETTVNYVLAAWDTGTQNLGLGDVSVVTASGQQLASLRALSVYVRSVLPVDTAQRKPKPPRPVVPLGVVDWLAWAVAALVALLLALAYWLWNRRRRGRDKSLTPLEWAEREFVRIEGSSWLEEGVTEWYAIAMATVVRGYLSRIDPGFAASLTTRELAEAVVSSSLPGDRLIALLEEVDPLKFAAQRMSRDAAVRAGTEARAVVGESDRALVAIRAAAVAAASGTSASERAAA